MTGLKTGPGSEFDSFGEILEVIDGPWLNAHKRIAGLIDVKGDGTDDEDALEQRLNALTPGGSIGTGGRLWLSARTYGIDSAVSMKDKTGMIGCGQEVTTLKRLTSPGGGGSTMGLTNAEDVYVGHLTLDGNFEGFAQEFTGELDGGSHTFTSSGNGNTRTVIEYVTIRNSRGYGMAHEDFGPFQRNSYSHITIENCTSDGIDHKNDREFDLRGTADAILGNHNNTYHDITVRRFGHNLTEGGKCGIDCRGYGFQLSAITVEDFGHSGWLGQNGIRFRFDSANGRGGDESTLTGFHVDSMGRLAPVPEPRPANTVAVYIAAQNAVTVMGGTGRDLETGIMVLTNSITVQDRHSIIGTHMIDCDKGYWIQEDADHMVLAATTADQCDIGYQLDGNRANLQGPIATNGIDGIVVTSTSTGARIDCPILDSNSGDDIRVETGASGTLIVGVPASATVEIEAGATGTIIMGVGAGAVINNAGTGTIISSLHNTAEVVDTGTDTIIVDGGPQAYNGIAPDIVDAQTVPRHGGSIVSTGVAMTDGRERLAAIWLRAGETPQSASFRSRNQAAVNPAHWWFSLRQLDKTLLCQTADQTTAAWAADTGKTLNFVSPPKIATTGWYLLGVMMATTAGTAVNLLGANADANLAGLPPVMNGLGDTGLTATAPQPMGAITGTGGLPWAGVKYV